jgi:Tfp pilus assembly protein PilV
MIRRTGVSLIEVLVAIFVTALGLLALLALFPLGAVNMAQAIRDSRTAHAAADAAANIKAWPISQPQVANQAVAAPSYAPMHTDFFISAAYAGSAPLPPPNPNDPSYAVYVDPAGIESYSSVQQFARWVAGVPGIPRQTLSIFNPTSSTYITNPVLRRATLLRWFTLLDDIAFGTNGLPSGGVVQRENRYSWAYVLRRPRYSDASVVEMTIAVYDRRPLQLGAGSLLPVGETAYPVESDPADPLNTLNLVYAGGLQKPALRTGGWIFDATPLPGHGYFYRVVSVTETSSLKGQPAVKVELQNNVRTLDGNRRPIFTQAVVMDNLAEVFERGPVSVP